MIQIVALLALACAQPADRHLSTLGVDIDALPTVVVDHDDFRITKSCKISIPPGTIIEDVEGDGVIQIGADYVYIEFIDGSLLQGRAGIDDWLARGTGKGEDWDTLTGTAITIDGHAGVEIVGANIRGYRNGIVASDAQELMVRDATLTDMYRQRLTSTATREGSGDWLWPHHNDENEWLANYGAAIWLERSGGGVVTNVRVRRGQNGIILDSSDAVQVSNNDCSFLSGWGLAMWRSSGNQIRDNRFDFCVRGHVEGVYNRGQDSAGILMFEECQQNKIINNSCMHCGDGIFGFGGNDAVEKATEGAWGNANNYFLSNDLSFASAHGLEMTFSENNTIVSNLFESNAICGIWGGYSQGFSISSNRFLTNGGMTYGAERGAINIEHGSGHVIRINRFVNNKCGVRLWWDFDELLLGQPGVSDKNRGVVENKIESNWFTMNRDHPFGLNAELIGIELQDIGEAPGYTGVRVGENEIDLDDNQWTIDNPNAVQARILGQEFTKQDPDWPAGNWRFAEPPKRISPPGREWIIVDQWGPWDFESPTMREHSRSGSTDTFEIYIPKEWEKQVHVEMRQGVNEAMLDSPDPGKGWKPWLLTINADPREPISSYTAIVRVGDDWSRIVSGRFINAKWAVRCWAWAHDPLTDADAWRAEADAVEPVTLDRLDLPFANGGPSRISEKLSITDRDRFGLLASTTIALPRGQWKLTTRSDDGIRVKINGEQVIERWDIHAPTPDDAVFTVNDGTPTRIEVEYFENDGYATLELDLQPIE